jgi:hypothetical protein
VLQAITSHEGTASLFLVKPISYDVLCVAAHVCKGNKGEKYILFSCKYAGGVVRSLSQFVMLGTDMSVDNEK